MGHLKYGYSQIEKLAAYEAVEVSVIFVVQMPVEGQDQFVPLLLRIFDHFSRGIFGQVLHQTSLQCEPQGAREIKEKGLPKEAEGDPLVKRVEHLVTKLVQVSFPGAASLEVVGYVEAAVHPAVVLQGVTAHSSTRQVALDWVSKELVETSHGREDKKQHACVLKSELIQSEGLVLSTL